jgi:hypothetical protein
LAADASDKSNRLTFFLILSCKQLLEETTLETKTLGEGEFVGCSGECGVRSEDGVTEGRV